MPIMRRDQSERRSMVRRYPSTVFGRTEGLVYR